MDEKKKVSIEFLKTMTQLATAGFGLVAALAWNDMIQSFINSFISVGAGILSKLFYAIIVTAIAVAVTYSLGKMSQEAANKEK